MSLPLLGILICSLLLNAWINSTGYFTQATQMAMNHGFNSTVAYTSAFLQRAKKILGLGVLFEELTQRTFPLCIPFASFKNSLVTSTVWIGKPALYSEVFGASSCGKKSLISWVAAYSNVFKKEKNLQMPSKGSCKQKKRKRCTKHLKVPTSGCQQLLLFIVIVL